MSETSEIGVKREAPAPVAAPQYRPKREKSNSKAVDCFDLNGNLLKEYPSGIAIATALNIQQGDISLCCRGLKHSVSGFRFRFHGDPNDPYEQYQLRKASAKEQQSLPRDLNDTNPEQLTRTRRRASVMYSEIGLDGEPQYSDKRDGKGVARAKSTPHMDHITHIKVRKWSKRDKVQLGKGSFFIAQWVPDAPNPNPVFKSYLPKKSKKKRYERKKNPLDAIS